MVKEVMTSNKAVAEAVRLAKPQVIPVYPITPQTTISEYLAQYVADEKIDAKYVKVESEHSAISAAVGASGAGVRVFTATSSQGLMLMHEILYAAAGMRTPFVLADANRAISAPLNIWNDQQDSIAQKDAGWLQIDILLPSMVCLDGFILTHTVEPVEIPDQESVDAFLPPYVPEHAYLDPKDPMSIGNFADPEYYMEARHDMDVAMNNALDVIQKTCDEFAEIFGRQYGLVEGYKTEDAEIIYVAMGSLCSSIRVIVDELRAKGEKVGLLKIRSYRPFPVDAINEVVKNCSKLAVVDKNFAIGMGGALFGDMKLKIDKEIYGFITGLGGRDITPEALNEIYEITKNGPENDVTWIGLKEE